MSTNHFGVNGKEVEIALDKMGLTLNANAVADDPLPPFKPKWYTPWHASHYDTRPQGRAYDTNCQWMRQAIDA